VALALNEIGGTTNSPFWLELMNYGTNVISLDGSSPNDGTNNFQYVIPAG
jgi:hypothetical protein